MDIFITGNLPTSDTDTEGRSIKLRIPVLPEEILFSSATKFAEYNILDLGPVIQPNGDDIGEYRWESMLPGNKRKKAPWIKGDWKDPKTIQTYFSVWRKRGVKLKLLITGTPINHYVYLSNYEIRYSGAYGDYFYSINFKDARMIEVTSSVVQAPKQEPETKRQTPEKSRSYTIKSGDTLWDIAREYYGSGTQYDKIYQANKGVIESTAKKHGKSSSQNGHWIYPGCSITIP